MSPPAPPRTTTLMDPRRRAQPRPGSPTKAVGIAASLRDATSPTHGGMRRAAGGVATTRSGVARWPDPAPGPDLARAGRRRAPSPGCFATRRDPWGDGGGRPGLSGGGEFLAKAINGDS
ncbi:hypothetical protein U9M48_040429 [Paspalum notatum var. saurae]|uniref:Uncharacterized protein n=1 Tax=Paspalum notatum var. saurae TaxID=547442 RepID=A0AAQ3UMW6_PASNO